MKPSKLHPALLGGLFIGVVSALPIVGALNGCCCVWLIAGGVLAAYVMQQNHPLPISLVDGAAAGFFAGVFGCAVMLVVTLVLSALHLAGPSGGIESLTATRDMSPEVREMLRRVDPGMLAILFASAFAVVGIVASTIGGAIGAALFKRAAPPPPPDLPPVWGPPTTSWAPTPDVPPAPSSPPQPIVSEEPAPSDRTDEPPRHERGTPDPSS